MTAPVREAGSASAGSLGLKLLVAFVVTVFCTATVPGDIGGCGQEARALDAESFFASRRHIDCSKCTECGFRTGRCADACRADLGELATFPEGCLPLVHDGVVCLRRLQVTSCGDYEPYVADRDPQTPTECNFCPRRGL